jgi:UDP-N-acetylglucosamine transferase subunit ALG13
MILVVVGSSQFPFDRLLRAVDALAFDEPLLVQHGPSTIRPRGAECIAFLPLEELTKHVRGARTVVSHAGVGSILLALMNGKRPVVVPRLHAYRETVDDHQLESARRFAKAGLVRLVEDPIGLAPAILGAEPEVELSSGEPPLVQELRAYLEHQVHLEHLNHAESIPVPQ